ncbi:hypothetical protein Hanom_Chr15g01346191 [Helianthus anomalus]
MPCQVPIPHRILHSITSNGSNTIRVFELYIPQSIPLKQSVTIHRKRQSPNTAQGAGEHSPLGENNSTKESPT